MKTKFIILLLPLVLYSCVRMLPDEELTMTRTPYTGKEIRLDGYYTGASPGQNTYYDYIFFYSNGVVFSFGYFPNIDINQHLSQYDKIKTSENINCWQIFKVENDTIHLQGWENLASGFFGDSQNTIKDTYYKIINDTTLYYETHGYKTNYYFKKFGPKPDSTNVFIK